MKIDFYDLFSLHTPNDFSDTGEENYITAAVKSRVMENIPAVKSKPVRIGKIGRAFIAAAAVAVVLITCTFAASALGLIDLEKIFGGMFRSGTENLAGITAVPQNVVTTGDDRLSLRVLGIAGTEDMFVGSIEIKRSDGGVFPQYIQAGVNSGFDEELNSYMNLSYGPALYDDIQPAYGLNVIDETTAIYYFSVGVGKDISNDGEASIIGKMYTVEFSDIDDCTELANLLKKYDVYIDNEEDAAYYDQLMENKNTILEGKWSITFPIEYNADCRKLKVNNEPFSKYGISSSVITGAEYSALSLYIYLDEVYGDFGWNTYDVIIQLDSGEQLTVPLSSANGYVEDGKPAIMYYLFDKPIDIDSVESITIGDVVIPAK